MTVRFPVTHGRLGLGIGLDLPWGLNGFVHDAQRGDMLAPRVKRFLAGEAVGASHLFVSWQPRDRARPRLADYAPAWDDLWSAAPADATRALHHTALNLGAVDGYGRSGLIDFTNALVERYALQWINEDLGLWSLGGKPLPYPLPPYLTTGGLRAAITAVRECQAALIVPLVVEFPGFSQGVSLPIGPWDAYDFFRALAEDSGSPVTLDIGHLLSWRWLRGSRGEALYNGLERLPVAQCFEIHLSGCALVGDRFIDAHHGVLLEEQFELLTRLLPMCPNLRAITYEDPQIDDQGSLQSSNRPSFERLGAIVGAWLAEPMPEPVVQTRPSIVTPSLPEPEPDVRLIDAALVELSCRKTARDLLRTGELQHFGPAAKLIGELDPDELDAIAVAIGKLLLRRTHRGTGGLLAWYPRTVIAWQVAQPRADLADLATEFLASPAAAAWREGADDRIGISLEEAFFRFAEAGRIADEATREHELLAAIVRGLAICPEPAFLVPQRVRRCPGGWVAIARGKPSVLYAALGTHYVTGSITSLLADLIDGVEPTAAVAVVSRARGELSAMGLLSS